MPRPRSKFSRSGSVTGGCSGRLAGSKPAPLILHQDLEAIVALLTADRDPLLHVDGAVGLDRVGARFGYGQLQIVDAVVGQLAS